jgi:DNA-binding GntR family transcriptional regulator
METSPAASSLTHATYQRLRTDILECRLAPGKRLKIGELCQNLSVSLSAVREALSRLTSEGLVVAEPQRGFRVAPISSADLNDLTRTRTEIESLCLRLAIVNGDIAWESRLVAAFHNLIRRPSPTRLGSDPDNCGWAVAHAEFHEALASACDSPRLLAMRRLLHLQNERYRRIATALVDCWVDVDRQHRELMQAAIDRDVERAVASMTEHVAQTADVLLGAIGPLESPASERSRGRRATKQPVPERVPVEWELAGAE